MMRYVKRYFKVQPGYGIYLLTLVLSIVIFYVFNALNDGTMIDLLMQYQGDYAIYVQLLDQLMQGISIVVLLIFVLLIGYGGSIIFKRRASEFALRMLNGQSYPSLVAMLVKEHLLIDSIALVLGLTIGILFSQLINMLIIHLFNGNINLLGFTVSIHALKSTLVLTLCMMVLSLLIQCIMIHGLNLNTLLHHAVKSMRSRLPLPLALIIAILSISGLTMAYSLIFDLHFLSNDINVLLIPISLGIITTYGLFKSIPLLVLWLSNHIVSLNHGIRFYMIKSAMMNLSHHAGIYSLVCLTLFLSLCAFGVATGINTTYGESLDHAMKTDVMIKRYSDENGNVESMDSFLQANGIHLDEFDAYASIYIYDDPLLTYGTLANDAYDTILDDVPNFDMDTEVDIITMEDFNTISGLTHEISLDLPYGSYAIAVNSDVMEMMEPIALQMVQANPSIKVGDVELERGYDHVLNHGYTTMGNGTDILLVVNMDVSSLQPYASYFLANYHSGINHDQYLNTLFQNGPYTRFDSRQDTLNQADMLAMVMAVVGIYLAMALSLSCGALIALKTLSYTLDRKNEYRSIYKIGYSRQNCMMYGLNHILIAFGLPLLLALIHNYKGLKFVEFISNGILVASSFAVYGITMFILVIYLIYMAMTAIVQRGIISKALYD